jgi:hypothetical protein
MITYLGWDWATRGQDYVSPRSFPPNYHIYLQTRLPSPAIHPYMVPPQLDTHILSVPDFHILSICHPLRVLLPLGSQSPALIQFLHRRRPINTEKRLPPQIDADHPIRGCFPIANAF